MDGERILLETWSVCPACLRRVRAQRVQAGGRVVLRKACPAHGRFESVIWRGYGDLAAWVGGADGAMAEEPRCPDACGLCPDHRQGTCCVLLEVTRRCNLNCPYCFADGEKGADPSLAQLAAWLRQLAEPGKTLVQLSGGEPTLRDDLPAVVAAAKEAGCAHVQLNSNGLRLAADPAYVDDLAGAGLSFVFLQFDGTDDRVHERLRGRPLRAEKLQAVENCAARGLGVVLVPTLVPGVNTDDIGGLVRLGVSLSPAVRGVHFQPFSRFGRRPAWDDPERRLTLDELRHEVAVQTGGLVRAEDLLPSRCDHPLCGFHGDFVTTGDGRLVSLSRRAGGPACCCGSAGPEQNRNFVARRWQRPAEAPAGGLAGDLRDMENFLELVRQRGFTLTAMAFQDAGSLDFSRLRRCSLHVFDDGNMVPFCAYYLTK